MFIKTRCKVYNWLREARDELEYDTTIEDSPKPKKMKKSLVSGSDSSDLAELECPGISFKVIPGDGGVAIEVRHYDMKTDRYTSRLHVVPVDADLAQALSQIITITSLRS